jgi:hypothetical protein
MSHSAEASTEPAGAPVANPSVPEDRKAAVRWPSRLWLRWALGAVAPLVLAGAGMFVYRWFHAGRRGYPPAWPSSASGTRPDQIPVARVPRPASIRIGAPAPRRSRSLPRRSPRVPVSPAPSSGSARGPPRPERPRSRGACHGRRLARKPRNISPLRTAASAHWRRLPGQLGQLLVDDTVVLGQVTSGRPWAPSPLHREDEDGEDQHADEADGPPPLPFVG